MRTLLILLVGSGGLWLTLRHLRRNLREIQAKPKDQVQPMDKVVNYPLMVLWFGYLIVFFGGLIVNNLIFR
jgi:hypothetical protein